MPQKYNAALKKVAFLGFNFWINSFSLLNTISVLSNISLMLAAIMQMLSRYKKSVTDCSYARHISVSLQKLNPEFDRPNGIHVKLHNPDDLAWKAVLVMSTSSTGILK